MPYPTEVRDEFVLLADDVDRKLRFGCEELQITDVIGFPHVETSDIC